LLKFPQGKSNEEESSFPNEIFPCLIYHIIPLLELCRKVRKWEDFYNSSTENSKPRDFLPVLSSICGGLK